MSDRYVNARDRLHYAFETAEREWGVGPLLDPEDVDTDHPDEKSIITYVSSLYNGLPSLDELLQVTPTSALSSGVEVSPPAARGCSCQSRRAACG